MTMNLKIQKNDLTIVAIYAPTNDTKQNIKDEFGDTLIAILNKIEKNKDMYIGKLKRSSRQTNQR